jgi:hypothetical protein
MAKSGVSFTWQTETTPTNRTTQDRAQDLVLEPAPAPAPALALALALVQAQAQAQAQARDPVVR